MRRAVSKLLHTPMVRAKELSAGPDGLAYLELLASLFDVDRIGTAS